MDGKSCWWPPVSGSGSTNQMAEWNVYTWQFVYSANSCQKKKNELVNTKRWWKACTFQMCESGTGLKCLRLKFIAVILQDQLDYCTSQFLVYVRLTASSKVSLKDYTYERGPWRTVRACAPIVQGIAVVLAVNQNRQLDREYLLYVDTHVYKGWRLCTEYRRRQGFFFMADAWPLPSALSLRCLK